jgi:putative membrane protein
MKTLMIRGVTAAGSLALLLGLAAARGQDAQRGQLTQGDYKFVEKASRGGTMEVQAGELAQQKGASEAVRSFGLKIVADHSKANEQLRTIATRRGAVLPAQGSHHERDTIEDLQKASGTDFDRTYAKQMVKDHETNLKEFQDAARDLNDPDLRAFAERTVPVLQEHLRMAQDMERSVKNEK